MLVDGEVNNPVDVLHFFRFCSPSFCIFPYLCTYPRFCFRSIATHSPFLSQLYPKVDMHSLQVFLLVATIVTEAVAQTFSSCNPLNATCPPNAGLNQWSFMSDFTSPDAAITYQKSWTTAAGTKLGFGDPGMSFSISSSSTSATLYSNL